MFIIHFEFLIFRHSCKCHDKNNNKHGKYPIISSKDDYYFPKYMEQYYINPVIAKGLARAVPNSTPTFRQLILSPM